MYLLPTTSHFLYCLQTLISLTNYLLIILIEIYDSLVFSIHPSSLFDSLCVRWLRGIAPHLEAPRLRVEAPGSRGCFWSTVGSLMTTKRAKGPWCQATKTYHCWLAVMMSFKEDVTTKFEALALAEWLHHQCYPTSWIDERHHRSWTSWSVSSSRSQRGADGVVVPGLTTGMAYRRLPGLMVTSSGTCCNWVGEWWVTLLSLTMK